MAMYVVACLMVVETSTPNTGTALAIALSALEDSVNSGMCAGATLMVAPNADGIGICPASSELYVVDMTSDEGHDAIRNSNPFNIKGITT